MTFSEQLAQSGRASAIPAREALHLADTAGRIVIAAALGIECAAIHVAFDQGKGRRVPVYDRPPNQHEQALMALGGAECIRRLSGMEQGDEAWAAPLMQFIRLALERQGREKYVALLERLAECRMIGTTTPLAGLIPATVPDPAITAQLAQLIGEHADGR